MEAVRDIVEPYCISPQVASANKGLQSFFAAFTASCLTLAVDGGEGLNKNN